MVTKKFLSKSDAKAIFSNVEAIYEVNTAFLVSLERSRTIQGQLNPNIGILFNNHVSDSSD